MTKKKLWVILASTVVALGIIITLLYVFTPVRFAIDHYFRPNYAEGVARPVEEALLKTGAVKRCNNKDDGKGSDNQLPWYNAVFETNKSKDEAVQLINDVAKENGYSLTYQQSPHSHIDWYSDAQSKQSNHPELEDGKVKLSMNVYSGGENLSCADGTSLKYGPDRAAIMLSIQLPPLRNR